jgi:hypothetical protein
MSKVVKLARHMALIPIIEGWSTQDYTERPEDLALGGRHDRLL